MGERDDFDCCNPSSLFCVLLRKFFCYAKTETGGYIYENKKDWNVLNFLQFCTDYANRTMQAINSYKNI